MNNLTQEQEDMLIALVKKEIRSQHAKVHAAYNDHPAFAAEVTKKRVEARCREIDLKDLLEAME